MQDTRCSVRNVVLIREIQESPQASTVVRGTERLKGRCGYADRTLMFNGQLPRRHNWPSLENCRSDGTGLW